MQLKVLGNLVFADGKSFCTPKAPKTRAVLAVLAMNANRTVSSSILIEEVWRDAPPLSAPSTLQTYICQIRECIACMPACAGNRDRAREILSTQYSGYQLNVEPDFFDMTVFHRRWRDGQRQLIENDFTGAAATLGNALSLWRGSPLADVQLGPVLEPHVRKLNEQRLAAIEGRIEAELALGHYQETVADLVGLTCSNPLHEGLHAHLMRALYMSGRRSESLEVYQLIRRRLLDTAGLEPSARLREEQRLILCEEEPVPAVRQAAGFLRAVPNGVAS